MYNEVDANHVYFFCNTMANIELMVHLGHKKYEMKDSFNDFSLALMNLFIVVVVSCLLCRVWPNKLVVWGKNAAPSRTNNCHQSNQLNKNSRRFGPHPGGPPATDVATCSKTNRPGGQLSSPRLVKRL